jgi:hypothetical protein
VHGGSALVVDVLAAFAVLALVVVLVIGARRLLVSAPAAVAELGLRAKGKLVLGFYQVAFAST